MLGGKLTCKLQIGILVVERADGVGLQKFSAKTFSGEHNIRGDRN